MPTSQEHRYLFGPVHSRRLGLSLGIDLVPMKTCTFNCIFCQLGRTTFETIKRAEYVPTAEVMAELAAFIENDGKADYLTFSGSGEPTLHRRLGEMIAQTKRLSQIPVAVLTCGALMFDPQVRRELSLADVVLPSLSAASPDIFDAINRPHGRLRAAEIIAGLKHFRREYHGQIWLEIMFVKGINDDPREISQLRQAIAEIKPDKVHLNTAVRPPAENEVRALSAMELQALQLALGPPAEIIAERPSTRKTPAENHVMAEVVELLARHPATFEEIAEYVNGERKTIAPILQALAEDGVIEVREHEGKTFYAAVHSH